MMSSPTAPASGQVQAAEAECQDEQGHALASQTPTLVDTRGPYTLLIYGQSEGGICRTGPKFAGARVSLFQRSHLPAQYQVSLTAPKAADQIRTIIQGADYIDTEEQRYGPEYGPNAVMYLSYIGRVGSEVTGVTLTLRDGEQIQATTENGWYAAWWPAPEGPSTQSYEQSVATSAQITTAGGTITQQLVIANTEAEAEGWTAHGSSQAPARIQQSAAGSSAAEANAAMAEAEAEGWTREKFREDLRARIQQATPAPDQP